MLIFPDRVVLPVQPVRPPGEQQRPGDPQRAQARQAGKRLRAELHYVRQGTRKYFSLSHLFHCCTQQNL